MADDKPKKVDAYAKGDIRPPNRPGGQGGQRQYQQTREEAKERRLRYLRNKSDQKRKAIRRYKTRGRLNMKMRQRRKEYRKNPKKYRRGPPRPYEREEKKAMMAQRVAARYMEAEGVIFYYDIDDNPGNSEIKQPGPDVNYRAVGPTTYELMPDDRDGVGPAQAPPSDQSENVPPASSRVIPDAMKNTLEDQLAQVRFASATISQIIDNCGPLVKSRAEKITQFRRLRRHQSGMTRWEVTGSSGDKYIVRLKPIKKGNTKYVNKLPVKVSCTCPFFRWQGPEHWAKTNDYLWGKPRGTASLPVIRDPIGEHWACKHVLAVLNFAKKNNWRIASQDQWSYDGPLAPLPDEGRVAARYLMQKEAERRMWWHGSAGKNLRSILKQGLIPTGDLVYDTEIDSNQAGGRSIKTFGGVYFSSQWFTAYASAGRANPGRGKPRVIVGATLDNRSPDILLDEDDMVQGVERIMGRTFDEVARQILLPEGLLSSWGGVKPGSHGELRSFLLDGADYKDMPAAYLDLMLRKYPKLEGRVQRQREKLEGAIRDVLAAYAVHLLEASYHRYKDQQTKSIQDVLGRVPEVTYYTDEEKEGQLALYKGRLKAHLADERQLKGSFALLQKATNVLGRMMREATEMPDASAGRHNIRVMRPVTYRGKDRILLVASITDDVSQVWKARGEFPNVTDIVFHYGAQHRKPFLKDYAEGVGGIARVLDSSGKVLEILDPRDELSKRGWPSDLWGPAPSAYRDVAASSASCCGES